MTTQEVEISLIDLKTMGRVMFAEQMLEVNFSGAKYPYGSSHG